MAAPGIAVVPEFNPLTNRLIDEPMAPDGAANVPPVPEVLTSSCRWRLERKPGVWLHEGFTASPVFMPVAGAWNITPTDALAAVSKGGLIVAERFHVVPERTVPGSAGGPLVRMVASGMLGADWPKPSTAPERTLPGEGRLKDDETVEFQFHCEKTVSAAARDAPQSRTRQVLASASVRSAEGFRAMHGRGSWCYG